MYLSKYLCRFGPNCCITDEIVTILRVICFILMYITRFVSIKKVYQFVFIITFNLSNNLILISAKSLICFPESFIHRTDLGSM